LAGDVLLAFKERFFEANPEIKPGGTMKVAEECDDARKAVQQIIIQDVGAGYVDVIRIFERMADVVSMIPQISQGVRPEKSADTAYELSQLLENAGKYLGSVIRNYDQGLVEPIGSDFLRYNMLDPEAPGKGDFVLKALGFSSFQARIVRTQKLLQMLGLVMQYPELLAEAKPRPMLDEIFKSVDLDPGVLLKSEQDKEVEAKEKQEALAQQLAMQQQAQSEALAMAEGAKDAEHGRRMELEGAKAAGSLAKTVLGKSAPTPQPMGLPVQQ
ncbi:MAG: hypothetical protein M0R22_11675, partial [Dehalococcoidia bacterium]|nr:hypothetical protein [Dehalococcoidia bacterium]